MARVKSFIIQTVSAGLERYQVIASKIDSYKKPPDIRDTNETIQTLMNNNVSISRFGDGEFGLIFGWNIRYQIFSDELREKLLEVLHSNVPNHLVAISDVFGDMKERNAENRAYWAEHLKRNRHRYYKHIDMSKTYYNTSASRVYKLLEDKTLAKERFACWKKIWDGKDIVFIEGSKTRMGMGNDLFANARSIKRILCPAENAFAKWRDILDYASQMDHDVLFILALGPTATVLSYELAKLGYRALDLGHIDIEYEWYLRENCHADIDCKYVNEVVGGNVVSNEVSEEYQKQILCEF